jgi:AcrR family transcriptional regulator
VQPVGDRRARKKAQTRAEVLQAAQRLFAERGFDAVTISDIASAADVAVQTVFNHFPGKEELFFAGRTPPVDGAADAVRSRPAGMTALAALRAYTADLVRGSVEARADAEQRALIAALEASPALQNALPAVQRRAEVQLAAALVEAWTGAEDGAVDDAPLDVRLAAGLTAAAWITAARGLVQELSRLDGDDGAARARVEELATRLFDRLETGLPPLLDVPQRG